MVSVEFSEGITETLDILKHMKEADVNKISKGFMEFLEKNQSKDYVPNLDHSKKLNEMNLKEKTKDILATIYLNYWCNDEQKADYLKVLKENEKKHQEELRARYNPDSLFNNKTTTKVNNEPSKENVALVEVKESILTKFIKIIKKIFHIK